MSEVNGTEFVVAVLSPLMFRRWNVLSVGGVPVAASRSGRGERGVTLSTGWEGESWAPLGWVGAGTVGEVAQ